MLNGDIRSKIDALWNAFWTGGISNPLEVAHRLPSEILAALAGLEKEIALGMKELEEMLK